MKIKTSKKLNNILRKNEFYVVLLIIMIIAFVEIRSGQFFTANNVVDIIRSGIIPVIYSIGVLVVLISGGLDLSIASIAGLSIYVTNSILTNMEYEGPVIFAYLIAASIGIVCGAFNAFVITTWDLHPMIVTLGTQSVLAGLLRGVLSGKDMKAAPVLKEFGQKTLFSVTNSENGLSSSMPATVFIMIGLLVVAYFILRHTMLGRGIYAIGGDKNAANRIGYNVKRIQYFVYCFSGVMAATAGVTYAAMSQFAYFTSVLGSELTYLSATVLGGAGLAGGVGTIFGTLMGSYLMTILSNSLVLIGISTYWQSFFSGAIIVTGAAFSVYQNSRPKPVLNSTHNTSRKRPVN